MCERNCKLISPDLRNVLYILAFIVIFVKDFHNY